MRTEEAKHENRMHHIGKHLSLSVNSNKPLSLILMEEAANSPQQQM
jgi:hypothetical protein